MKPRKNKEKRLKRQWGKPVDRMLAKCYVSVDELSREPKRKKGCRPVVLSRHPIDSKRTYYTQFCRVKIDNQGDVGKTKMGSPSSIKESGLRFMTVWPAEEFVSGAGRFWIVGRFSDVGSGAGNGCSSISSEKTSG